MQEINSNTVSNFKKSRTSLIYFDSFGGSYLAGIDLYQYLSSSSDSRAFVHKAESMAVISMLGCRTRIIHPDAWLRFHLPSKDISINPFSNLREIAELKIQANEIFEVFWEIVNKHSLVPKEKFVEWSKSKVKISPKTALSYGLIHEITEQVP